MMKQFISLSILLFLVCTTALGQFHWLINVDSTPNCDLMKEGKFINKESNEKATEGYFIVVKDGYATEYVSDGKYYVKSKIEFLSRCKYKSIVKEVTIPDYNLAPGTVIYTEIVETATIDKLIHIKSTLDETSNYFVFQKVEN